MRTYHARTLQADIEQDAEDAAWTVDIAALAAADVAEASTGAAAVAADVVAAANARQPSAVHVPSS